MKVIVGLGNPGKDYEKTRHNVGFMVIDEIANKLGISGGKEKFDSLLLEDFVGREKVVLVKPLTFMNDSGRAVRRIMDFYSLDPGDIIVIYDDVDIDLGKLRIRKNGSAGTHNGMKSIMGSRHYPNFLLCRFWRSLLSFCPFRFSSVPNRTFPSATSRVRKSSAFLSAFPIFRFGAVRYTQPKTLPLRRLRIIEPGRFFG